MPDIHAVAVFCGAHPGNAPIFHDAATELGRALARAGMRLVYGGGRVGLMGAVADGAISQGGHVIGVIPEFLTRWEVAHDGVAELIVTDSMHSRKTRMFELSDAFVSLPGGLGTLDETIEILTWRQLRLHDKPILICNVAGSAEPLVAAVDAAIAAGFAKPDVRELFELVDGVAATVERLEHLNAARGGAAALL
ncbi:Cytokinin riboside 5'-monophosphate phosphoribohydrolase [Rhodovastum atsumiense]|uniref:Cytokinin riboside 5'-monophosphate phosphoribohydrolase n=1 Tax=Rhodovastum atsumiense TaxID=504468 RepID=A0A5M6IW55_9PROT|nr:TIGR00730 family Rossman fold protein [Rhodovastum atsumiense]KAA5612451.1 TIGR00730 family Rossman fold protein [Rhodovastum atsumiense]CAH2600360.1 Cytokinin riboside 5'-monophosphate phosphoribohydrolase [Rhodovastum atsumiense]